MNRINLRSIPYEDFSFKEESKLIKEIDNAIQHQYLKVIFSKTKEKMKSNLKEMNNIDAQLAKKIQLYQRFTTMRVIYDDKEDFTDYLISHSGLVTLNKKETRESFWKAVYKFRSNSK